jgi:hypothetical protein
MHLIKHIKKQELYEVPLLVDVLIITIGTVWIA